MTFHFPALHPPDDGKEFKKPPKETMPAKVISFHYTLKDPTGKKLDSSDGDEPLSFLEGVGQIIPGLESALLKLKVGEKKEIKVPAKDAYGARDEKRVIDVPLAQLPKKDIKIGDMFQAGQGEHSPPLTVIKVTPEHATLDANHPLAGVDLTFNVEITDIREATPEETDHGHAHGVGGHSH
jgi:FKBP-type peptidyl-prolyl cis-trans isomerase SlyD